MTINLCILYLSCFQRSIFIYCSYIVDCGTLQTPQGGSVSYFSTTFGAKANYTCNIGYDLEGEFQIECLPNGSWSRRPPTCNIKGMIRMSTKVVTEERDCRGFISSTNGRYLKLSVLCYSGKVI